MHKNALHDMEAHFIPANKLDLTDSQKTKFADLKKEFEPKYFELQQLFADTRTWGGR